MIAQKGEFQYRTMTEIATTQIKNAILKGFFQPGEKIVPAQIEKDFNLGKAAVRDAIRELTGMGLLISTPNKGTKVSGPISKEEIIEIFEIRYLLEGKAVFKAAQEMTEKRINELEEINKELKKIPGSYSNEYFLINKEFHIKLYEHSGWSFLAKIIEQIFDQISLYRIIYPFGAEDIKLYIEDHANILNAIRQKNPDEAKIHLLSHLKKGYESIIMLHKKARNNKNS